MGDSYPFLVLEYPCDEAVAWVVHQISGAGLYVAQTFDLQEVHHEPMDCPCAQHGSEQCDCQMVVLLVYGEDYQPVSLVVHSHAGKTWLTLVDTPQQRADPGLGKVVRYSLPV